MRCGHSGQNSYLNLLFFFSNKIYYFLFPLKLVFLYKYLQKFPGVHWTHVYSIGHLVGNNTLLWIALQLDGREIALLHYSFYAFW